MRATITADPCEGDCISNRSILRATSSPSSAWPLAPRRMITVGRLASRWLACGSPIVNVPQSQRASPGASSSDASARSGRVRALARVGEVVRVAAREQDDIAAAHALETRVAVNPKHEFALFNEVQGAGIGEAGRESPLRSVRHDPFSAQTDAPEQLREQVVRLAMSVEAERGAPECWTIGKMFPAEWSLSLRISRNRLSRQ